MPDAVLVTAKRQALLLHAKLAYSWNFPLRTR
jgi:hypothetical protein